MRPALVALAAAGGALAALVSPLAGEPLPWLVAAAAALAWPGRRRLLLAGLLGGLSAAWHGQADARDRAALAGLDDRLDDVIVGQVVGAIDEAPGGWRFVVATDAAAIEVRVAGDPATDCVGPCAAAGLLPGDRLRLVGRLHGGRGYRDPGMPDPRRRLAAHGAVAVLDTDWRQVQVVDRGRPSPWRLATRTRRAMSAGLPRRGDSAAVLAALVVGARAGIPAEVGDAYRAAGIAHVLAVSGLHLGTAALLLFALLRALAAALPLGARHDPGRLAALVAAPAAVFYALITGLSPSASRALVVVLVYLAGVVLQRRARLVDALGVAALLVVVVRPAELLDPALELSFAAAAALAVAAVPRPRPERLRPRVEWALWSLLRASLVAGLATWPLTALHFGVIQTGGLVANLVAVPVVALVVLPAGLAAALVGLAWPALAQLLAVPALVALDALDVVARAVAAHAPVLWTGAPRPLEWALAGLLATALLAWLRGRRRGALLVAGLAAAGLVAGWLWSTELAPARLRDLRVTFLDVGQGDAAVVELPGGGVWLIDAGGRPFVAAGASRAERARAGAAPGRAILAYLASRRLRRIDLVLLSHPHPDHYLGLRALAGRVAIDELWLADGERGAELDGILAELRALGTRVTAPPLGSARRQGDVELEVLWPRYQGPRAVADPIYSVNDNSLVVRVAFAGRALLFAGDLEAEGEMQLARAVGASALHADVVKVPHHGSPTSSTAGFIAAVRPALAVVSCGLANRFGFPSTEVVARWQASGARLLRTDQVGAVTVTVAAGGSLAVTTVD